MEAYEQVSRYRDPHGNVIWRGAEASEEQLRTIAADLEAGLQHMRDPLIRDLGEGSRTLRFRRLNLLIDLVKIHARRGDADAAFAAWNQLSMFSWNERMLTYFDADPHVQALRSDPRHAALQARRDIMRRMGDDSLFASTSEPDQAARIAGLARVWSVARDGFVWFDQVPGLDWDRRFAEFIPLVAAAEDTEAYYRLLMRFAAELRDGHSNVYPPETLESRFYSRPGLRTTRIDGEVLVDLLDDRLREAGTIAIGDRLLMIDGVDVDEYAATRIAPLQSSSTPQDLDIRTYRYMLLAGPADHPVALTLQRADGERYSTTVERSGFVEAAPSPSVAFELREDGIAVLRVDHFDDDEGIRVLEANLPRLFEARGLVIDLRGNGGGSSHHGWDILTWLSDKALPTPVSHYRENTAFDAARDGGTLTIEWRSIASRPYLNSRDRVFTGPVVMLIDARTFSAAEDTAAVFRLMQRGPIIGEPSGGSTGQPLLFRLPGGGSARICVKRDSYPDGSDFVGVGVLPDEIVRRSRDDVRNGRDPVMERAIEVLTRQAPSTAAR